MITGTRANYRKKCWGYYWNSAYYWENYWYSYCNTSVAYRLHETTGITTGT